MRLDEVNAIWNGLVAAAQLIRNRGLNSSRGGLPFESKAYVALTVPFERLYHPANVNGIIWPKSVFWSVLGVRLKSSTLAHVVDDRGALEVVGLVQPGDADEPLLLALVSAACRESVAGGYLKL